MLQPVKCISETISAWGTYLTCEENFVNYFQGRDKPTGDEARWGIRKREAGFRWYEHEERFVVEKHP
ncbi:MAG: DUF839 domain-containing protein, partial [Betaproteobacteria bacterium]|nr:DUF839 domain-containing protein [Betaproteobacteria bacterium]